MKDSEVPPPPRKRKRICSAEELGVKAKAWTFDCYPSWLEHQTVYESEADYFEHLERSGLCFAVAVHDKDETKPHYHVVVCYDGPTTRRCVIDAFSLILDNRANAANVQPVRSFGVISRYLLHMDNPEKHRYTDSCLRLFGGFEPDYESSPTARRKEDSYKTMWRVLNEYQCASWSELLDLLNELGEAEAAKTATRFCYAVRTYINEKGYKLK